MKSLSLVLVSVFVFAISGCAPGFQGDPMFRENGLPNTFAINTMLFNACLNQGGAMYVEDPDSEGNFPDLVLDPDEQNFCCVFPDRRSDVFPPSGFYKVENPYLIGNL